MRSQHILPLLLLLLLLSPCLVHAQQDTTLSLDVQIRARSEWRDGYKLAVTPGTEANLVTIQRSRLTLNGEWNRFDFRFGAQDIRTFGGPTGQTQGTIGVSEAWWAWNAAGGMRVTVGRQEIKFDDERVVGAVNWSNPGRFLDGIRWDRKADDPTQGNTTAAITWDELNQTRRIMAYHRAMIGERHRLSLLIFDQDSETEPSALTAGFTTRSTLGSNAWWATEAYLQQWDGGGTASMVIADAGLNGAGGHRWSTGLDLLTDDASSAAFQPFLGTNHKHYGWIDQFYVGTQSNGLTSLRLRHIGPLGQGKAWGATAHHFRDAMFGSLLGNELDLWVTGKADGALTWHVGWSVFDPTVRHIERQGDVTPDAWNDAAGRLQQWGWVSLNFTPSIDLR